MNDARGIQHVSHVGQPPLLACSTTLSSLWKKTLYPPSSFSPVWTLILITDIFKSLYIKLRISLSCKSVAFKLRHLWIQRKSKPSPNKQFFKELMSVSLWFPLVPWFRGFQEMVLHPRVWGNMWECLRLSQWPCPKCEGPVTQSILSRTDRPLQCQQWALWEAHSLLLQKAS